MISEVQCAGVSTSLFPARDKAERKDALQATPVGVVKKRRYVIEVYDLSLIHI